MINKAAPTVTYAGSGAAVYFGMSANEIAALGGLAIGLIGLGINWWYKHQHLKLAQKNAESTEEA